MKILAIESSCDDTAAAVVEDGRKILSSIVASQISDHKIYGGVVPEIASRCHAETIGAVTEAAMRKAILSLNYKPTVFIVSQRASSVMFADLIIVLDDGECVGCGKHDELLENCEVYREIYDSQFVKEAAAND